MRRITTENSINRLNRAVFSVCASVSVLGKVSMPSVRSHLTFHLAFRFV